MVRTSGETRLSDFLLLQSRWAALHFTPTLWPDFSFHDMLAALVQFQREAPAIARIRAMGCDAHRASQQLHLAGVPTVAGVVPASEVETCCQVAASSCSQSAAADAGTSTAQAAKYAGNPFRAALNGHCYPLSMQRQEGDVRTNDSANSHEFKDSLSNRVPKHAHVTAGQKCSNTSHPSSPLSSRHSPSTARPMGSVMSVAHEIADMQQTLQPRQRRGKAWRATSSPEHVKVVDPADSIVLLGTCCTKC